jgi:hypothetical protein
MIAPRFGERSAHERARREVHEKVASRKKLNSTSDKIPPVFNGELWNYRFNRPEIRVLCVLGPPEVVPVHWDPSYRRKTRDGRDRFGKLVCCPKGANCRFCNPLEPHIQAEEPRFDYYIPASKTLPGRPITAASPRVVWHLPQWTGDSHVVSLDNLVGQLFEVHHGPNNNDPEQAGELIVEPLNKRASNLRPTFDPRPSIYRVFGLEIPDELLVPDNKDTVNEVLATISEHPEEAGGESKVQPGVLGTILNGLKGDMAKIGGAE